MLEAHQEVAAITEVEEALPPDAEQGSREGRNAADEVVRRVAVVLRPAQAHNSSSKAEIEVEDEGEVVAAFSVVGQEEGHRRSSLPEDRLSSNQLPLRCPSHLTLTLLALNVPRLEHEATKFF